MDENMMVAADDEIKTCRTPWDGRLLLACRKCQKKLKKAGGYGELAGLKKAFKARKKKNPGSALHVLNVPCMKLCPKGAVAAYLPSRSEGRVLLLRSEDELRML